MNKETQQKISKAASRACIGKHFGISGQAVGKWIYENGVPQNASSRYAVFLTGK